MNPRLPEIVGQKEQEQYLESVGLGSIIEPSHTPEATVNQMIYETTAPPILVDQYRLHRFIVLNKRTTVLEFGCGWSSLVMAHAIEENRKKYSKDVTYLRRNNPFEVLSIDNERKYLAIAEDRTKCAGLTNITFHFSTIFMTTFNGRLSTQYKNLISFSPDFIYVDGPDQFNVTGSVNGLTTAHKYFMPMSSDILLIEHFLTPGTIIVFDGRGANARFVKENLQRNWTYTYDETFDHHVLFLDEEPLGKWNHVQLEFYGFTS